MCFAVRGLSCCFQNHSISCIVQPSSMRLFWFCDVMVVMRLMLLGGFLRLRTPTGYLFLKTRFGKRGWNNSNNWVGYIALFYWAGSGRALPRCRIHASQTAGSYQHNKSEWMKVHPLHSDQQRFKPSELASTGPPDARNLDPSVPV